MSKPEACGGARPSWIGSPFGLLVSVGVDRQSQPILHVRRVDDPDVAEFASFDHFPSLANHRIAGIVKGHRENEPFRASELDQFRGFGKRRRERLVADDLNTCLEERFCDGKVKVVRGDDDGGLYAVGAR